MSHSCSWNDMAGTSTPYKQPGGVAPGQGTWPPGRIASHHSHSDHSADVPAAETGPSRTRGQAGSPDVQGRYALGISLIVFAVFAAVMLASTSPKRDAGRSPI